MIGQVQQPLHEKKLVEDVLKYYEALKQEKQPYENVFEQIFKYEIPRRESFSFDRSQRGSKWSADVFDDEAIRALKKAVDGHIGYLVGKNIVWFRIGLEDEQYQKITGVGEWLQDTEKALYSEFRRSNFYDQIYEVFADGLSIGTANMYCEEDPESRKIWFTARHPMEYVIDHDLRGNVDTVIREYTLRARSVLKHFRQSLTPMQIDRYQKDPYKDVRMLHAVFPRETRDPKSLHQSNKRFASVYINKDENRVLRNSGYDDNPNVVWRYACSPGEVWGYGPGWDALQSTLRLNGVAEDMSLASQLSVLPPIRYSGDLEYDLDLNPKGMNPITSEGDVIEKIDLVGSYPFGKDREEMLKADIRDAFMVDVFLALSSGTSQKTAREVDEIAGERSALLGPSIQRTGSELLDPSIQRVYKIAYAAGRMPQPPDELVERMIADGKPARIKIEYIGPLAQAQKRTHAISPYSTFLNLAQPILELFPESKDNMDPDAAWRHLADETGFPQIAVRDEDTRDKIRQNRQLQMQAAVAAENMDRAADQAPKLAKAPESGSPLELMLKGA